MRKYLKILLLAGVLLAVRPQAAFAEINTDVGSLAIARVENYVNIRSEATTQSDAVGKLYNNAAAKILETVEGENGTWYKITSGDVSGYVKSEFFVSGEKAGNLAAEIGKNFARVSADSLRLRAQASTDSEILDVLAKDEEFEILGSEGDFYKITANGQTGYVSKDFITTRVELAGAEKNRDSEEDGSSSEEAAAEEAPETAAAGVPEAPAAGEAVTDAPPAVVPVPGSAPESAAPAESTVNSEEAADSAAERSAPAEGAVEAGKTASSESTSGPEIVPTPVTGETAAPALYAASAGDNGSEPAEVIEETEKETEKATEPETVSQKKTTVISTTVTGPGGGSGASQTVSATRMNIIDYARQFLGNPYVYGGTSLTNGCDCSGFTQQVYAHFGISTGRSSRDQAGRGKSISVDSVKPGDLLFYASGNYINHVGMYIGNGQIIHSSTPATGITITNADYRTPCAAVSFLE